MKNEKDDIIQQKESRITFTFEQKNDQLLIKAQSQATLYCGFLEPHPRFSFDKIKKALSTKNYELVSINHQQMELTIGAILDIQLKSQDQLTLEFLKDTIQKLTTKLQNESRKNTELESIVKQIQKDILQIKYQQDHQKTLHSQKIVSIESKSQVIGEKSSANSCTQNELIAAMQQEIFELREEISKQRQSVKSEFRAYETANDEHAKTFFEKLKTQLSQFITQYYLSKLLQQNEAPKTAQQITDLTAELTLWKMQFNQLVNQTIPKFLTEETYFMKFSRVICTLEEKSTIMRFFNKTIKQISLLYRASDNQFSTKKFHEKCDGIANTLTVIWTDFGHKIGGFTPLKWSSPKKDEWVADNSKGSFIFSVTHKDKFTLTRPEKATVNNEVFGPAFGSGCDIIVRDMANLNTNSFGRICTSYENENYKMGEKESWDRFHGGSTGSYFFKIKEWEVWVVDQA